MQKSGKFQGSHDKIDWKSRGVNFKKIDILNRGGTNLFWKIPLADTIGWAQCPLIRSLHLLEGSYKALTRSGDVNLSALIRGVRILEYPLIREFTVHFFVNDLIGSFSLYAKRH